MMLTMEVTPAFYELLCELAIKTGHDTGKVLRNGLVLLSLAVEAKRTGGNISVNGRMVHL